MFFWKKKEIKLQELLEKFKRERNVSREKINTIIETIIPLENLFNPACFYCHTDFSLDKERIEFFEKSYKNNVMNKEFSSRCSLSIQGMIDDMREDIIKKTLFISENPSTKEIGEVKKKIYVLLGELHQDIEIVKQARYSDEAFEIQKQAFYIKKDFSTHVGEICNRLASIIDIINAEKKKITIFSDYILYLQSLKVGIDKES